MLAFALGFSYDAYDKFPLCFFLVHGPGHYCGSSTGTIASFRGSYYALLDIGYMLSHDVMLFECCELTLRSDPHEYDSLVV